MSRPDPSFVRVPVTPILSELARKRGVKVAAMARELVYRAVTEAQRDPRHDSAAGTWVKVWLPGRAS